MADALIENPILNSLFLEPKRHFKFTDEGITNKIVAGRRISSYFIAELRNTGAGNLLMVFGEPDIDVTKKGNDLTVEIKGVDLYDPTTGQIRNASTDDIACWFIDTDYNGESFFVRQAYFTGADEPYEKLKRALKAEIDEAAWSSLYSTKSRPFPKPASKKIAVKVINHYGDEVLKVVAV
jgi:adenine-specific DNA-methyltransferase